MHLFCSPLSHLFPFWKIVTKNEWVLSNTVRTWEMCERTELSFSLVGRFSQLFNKMESWHQLRYCWIARLNVSQLVFFKKKNRQAVTIRQCLMLFPLKRLKMLFPHCPPSYWSSHCSAKWFTSSEWANRSFQWKSEKNPQFCQKEVGVCRSGSLPCSTSSPSTYHPQSGGWQLKASEEQREYHKELDTAEKWLHLLPSIQPSCVSPVLQFLQLTALLLFTVKSAWIFKGATF